MFLTADELRELTGAKRRATISRWLDDQRIPYLVGVDGWPRVSRVVISARVGESMQASREPRLHLG